MARLGGTAALVLVALTASAPAGAITCEIAAASKRLTTAQRAAWIERCRADLAVRCPQRADRRRLRGAARAAFLAACRDDALQR